MLLIDVSGSLDFGTRQRTMREQVVEIAATIAFSAIQNNDKIGVIFFSDKVEKFIPPKKGRKHILYIIRELLDFKPTGVRTDLIPPLEYLLNVQKRHCIAFILSDFICKNDFERPLIVTGRKHDVVAIRIQDRLLNELPDVGLIKVYDAETGHEQYIDTSSKKIRSSHAAWWHTEQKSLDSLFHRARIDDVCVNTDDDYVRALMTLFAKRY